MIALAIPLLVLSAGTGKAIGISLARWKLKKAVTKIGERINDPVV
jgi:hypothetical protein